MYNILLVHNFYKQKGGEDSVFLNEKELLKANGNNVIEYTRNNKEIDKYNVIQKVLFPINTIFNLETYKEINIILKSNKIDIIHVHNTLSLISFSVFYSAKKYNIPIIQTLHNYRMICPNALLFRNGHICEECIENNKLCSLRYRCYRNSFFETLALVLQYKIHGLIGILKYPHYLCLTNFQRKKIERFKYIDRNKIVIKPNFSYGNTIEKKKRNNYIFVGRLDETKGIQFVVESWEKLGNSFDKLIVCGNGELFNWCKQYISINHIENVELKGNVSNSEVIDLLSKSKALLFSSIWYECLPMTIIESYSVGTPVIAPNIDNINEIVIDGKTGLLYESQSFNDFYQSLSNVNTIDNKDVVNEYYEKYDEKNNYNKLINIYSSIISK